MIEARLAVVGAGLIGRNHAQLCTRTPGVGLAALVDPAPAARALAAQLGAAWFEDLGEMIEIARPDGVIVATPNALHLPQALALIAAGIPTLIEKPVAATVAEAETLGAAAAAAGARILVGHHRAHSPIMARAREIVASGALGRLVAVMGSAVFVKPDRYFADGPWRRQSGGGPILINMIHEVHNLRMLMGEIAQVQAIASHAVRGFAVEDTVAMSLRFAGGALGTFLLSDTAASPKSWEQTSRENPAYDSCDDEDCYVVMGTRGSLGIPTMRLRTYAGGVEPSWWQPLDRQVVALDRADPLARQMAHFAMVVRGEAAPLVTVADGLANLRVTEAIAKAAMSGAPVPLPTS